MKGLGLFASLAIPQGSLVSCYAGEVVDREEADRRMEVYRRNVSFPRWFKEKCEFSRLYHSCSTSSPCHVGGPSLYLQPPPTCHPHMYTKGRRHHYIMSLDGGEFIDATLRGSVARFINHSCSPNCRAEKWDVGGETLVGLYANRDIKADEEITYDYQVE